MKGTARPQKAGGTVKHSQQSRMQANVAKQQRTKGAVLVAQAKIYQALVRKHPNERTVMEEWESAPLGQCH
jgi:hypothetical protein